MQKRRKLFNLEKRMPILLILPVILYVNILMVYPLLFSTYISFHDWDLTRPTEGMRFAGLGNYAKILSDSLFWKSWQVTITFTAGVVIFEFLLGLGVALFVVNLVKGITFSIMRSIILIPMMITPIAVGITWRILYNYQYGIINYLLNLVGIPSVEWLGSSAASLISLMIVDIWQWTPFMFVSIQAGLLSLPREPFESAKVDGASRWQTFRYVTFPLLKPVLVIVILIRMIDALKQFDIIYSLTGGGPGTATETISYYIYRVGFKYFKMGYASALSLVTFVIIMALSLILFRLISRRST